jgi:hypothetical protein
VLEAQQSVQEAAARFLELFVCVCVCARARASERASERVCVMYKSSVPLPFSLPLLPSLLSSYLWPSFDQEGQLSTEPFVLS